MNPVQTGDRIGNYLLEQPCGEGSFGIVWKAKHHVFDEFVAIKVPTDPQYVRNLQREGVAIHGLRHDNIVRALDLDPFGDPPYLIMEYVDGCTLREAIDSYPTGLPAVVAMTILRGILQALEAAHAAEVIHRDLKPANILLAIDLDTVTQITTDQVKVADFGLGKIGTLTTASLMQSGSMPDQPGFSGTIAYMAPEQRDGHDVDHRCDLFACGLILFEMLTGKRPQGGDMPSHLNPQVPDALDQVFQRCYTRVERRFASATEVITALPLPQPNSPSTGWAAPLATAGSHCPECRSSVAGDDQFCIHCGLQLVEQVRRCVQCNAYAHPTDNYCIMCGAALASKFGSATS
jgi:serine/threonine-protein kinase